MHLPGLACVALLVTGVTFAQNAGSLEIHGRLMEAGLSTGIAGARVTVYQFSMNSERSVFATGTTDSQGSFEFHPERPGNYWVEAGKPGYFSTRTDTSAKESRDAALGGTTVMPAENTGTLATVNRDHPREFVRLALMRLAELTGRVLDDDDKPASGLLVEVLDSSLGERGYVRTNQDGAFNFKGLPPGRYFVRISALLPGFSRPITAFTDDDLNAADEGIQTFYWPGVHDVSAAGIVSVVSGTPMDLGSLHVHKGAFYRVKVSVAGCKPGDSLQFSAIPATQVTRLRADGTLESPIGPGPGSSVGNCGDFLVRGLQAGSYEFALGTANGWAVTRVEVADKNQVITMALGPASEIAGSVVAAYDGMQLPELSLMRIQLWPLGAPPFAVGVVSMTKVAGGGFSFQGVRWPRNLLTVAGVAGGYYVKEIRVDGVPAPEGIITTGPLSRVELVIDDQAASLTGTVTDGDKPAAQPKIWIARWPPVYSMAGAIAASADADGRFQVAGLAPGEYRLIAVPSGPIPDGASDWDIAPELWDSAARVTLERGKPASISLKLTDPILGN